MTRDYFFLPLSAACVRADAATDFTALDDFGLLNSFDAVVATLELVFSFFATATFLERCGRFRAVNHIHFTQP